MDLKKTVIGIELGSTRIKAVMVDQNFKSIASGDFEWENRLENGIWTYHYDEVETGLRTCFVRLCSDGKAKFGVELTTTGAIGISAMMHGYIPTDKNWKPLVGFRTWRNTITGEAAEKLTKLFGFNIPQRWCISHLYQAILNKEEHVKDIAYITTLAGYVHWKLTGKKVLGIGDASGMFPIDMSTKNYSKKMVEQFDSLIKPCGFSFTLEQILPEVLTAGTEAGKLTDAGIKFLDKDGDLESGTVLAPPEGDAGTGMVATNSVRTRTGNVSAGTSVFAMVVLEKELSKAYSGKIDLVTTPSGELVAMAHANNCTGEYDKWIHLFGEAIKKCGFDVDKGKLYDSLLGAAPEGDKDCGGCVPYNYISGESITGLSEGRPLFVRTQKNNFTLANFMRAQLFTSLGALRAGMDILFNEENVKIDRLTGHGGFFKTQETGLMAMSSAMHTPISLMETAGEGGPWGQAILAGFMLAKEEGETLEQYLNNKVFKEGKVETCEPVAEDVKGFDKFMEDYNAGLSIERAAVDSLK
jgi:sugar (pentulose or hexulose) kinase